ncbi:MAG TPA: hypothetical protein VGM56_09250 [Byssovorax sp.]
MLMPERRHALDRSRRARGARASWSLVVAALFGALGPLYACGGANPVAASGAGAGGSAGGIPSGGGADAATVDVAPNADDPPPFTGESYERYCGDPGACDIMTGLCTNAGGGGVAGAAGTGGNASGAGGVGGVGVNAGGGVGGVNAGGFGGASSGGGAGGAMGGGGAGGQSPGVAGGGAASTGEGASGGGHVGTGGGPMSGCKLAAIPDGGVQGPVDAGKDEDGGFYSPVVAVCATESKASDNAPCITASDCGPGQGCVGHPPTATCHIYCCGDLDTCPTDTWCVPQRMAEDTSIKIPVCLPATECTLLDDSDTCGPGLTCTVVRSDGAKATTSCVEPGTNTENEPCPCAAGYQCSRLAGVCLKLCHVGQDNECDHDAQCQGGSNSYPPGIGTCVGGL